MVVDTIHISLILGTHIFYLEKRYAEKKEKRNGMQNFPFVPPDPHSTRPFSNYAPGGCLFFFK